ncbi:MAG TPA: L-2-hydroxyglutarate oxidase [Solirubrobacterales bacterium]|jgi:2-hydroxyglutarate dehydrogenase
MPDRPEAQPPSECDLAVVGGGILGTAVARELARRHAGARICLLEAEPRLGAHQTGHSSGVIHAGIYYEPGSLKARLCVEGARALYDYCEGRGIEHRRSGKLVVAAREADLGGIDELERRGRANGVPGLRRLEAAEIPEIEPHARGLAALHSPATGVVDFVRVAEAFGKDFTETGGSIHPGIEVRDATLGADRISLIHARGTMAASAAVFCAGLWSDRLAVQCGAPAEPRIVPFRGAYLRLPPEQARLVRGNVYPVPDPDLPFLGAHLTRTLQDEVLIGPSALMVGARDAYRLRTLRARDLAQTLAWPGTWRMAGRHWRAGLREIRHAASRRSFVAEAARLVPDLRGAKASLGPAGIRAQAIGRDGRLVDDFVIHRTERAIHVRNAPSPAATSSLALAALIADEVAPII